MKRITLCRILGIIFILSGVAKAFIVNSFAYEVRLYSDAYFWNGLAYWATPIAVLDCQASRLSAKKQKILGNQLMLVVKTEGQGVVVLKKMAQLATMKASTINQNSVILIKSNL